MDRIHAVPGRATAMIALLLAAGLLGACGQDAPAADPGPRPAAIAIPTGSVATPALNIADICGRPVDSPAPSGRVVPERCETLVPRLNLALVAALNGQLPPGAEVTGNLNGVGGTRLGGQRPSFYPKHGKAGALTYIAPIRIRNGEFVANLDVTVGMFDTVPAVNHCPSAAQLEDMRARGIVTNRCTRIVDLAGNIVLVNDVSAPFGPGAWAKVLLRTHSVTAYRRDGTVVEVTVTPVLEQADDPYDFQPGDQPTMFTSDQVMALATDRSLSPIAP